MSERYVFNDILNPLDATGRLRLQENFTRARSYLNYLESLTTTAQTALQNQIDTLGQRITSVDDGSKARDSTLQQNINSRENESKQRDNNLQSQITSEKQRLDGVVTDVYRANQTATEARNFAIQTENQSEAAQHVSNEAIYLARLIQQQLNNLILHNGASDAEVIQARTNAVLSITYATLQARLDADFNKFNDVMSMRQHLHKVMRLTVDCGRVTDTNIRNSFNGGRVADREIRHIIEGGKVYA